MRRAAVAIGALLIVPAAAYGICPRPSGQYGARYGVVAGTYAGRGISPGGGEFVTLIETAGAAPVSLNVSGDVFAAAGKLAIGARITLFGYVRHAMSGAQPPYSCIE
ncbi:MAG TPA: hypothetical protein VGR91_16895 [Stellaceae bacterium]|nr:hypothetical protein [Stellaceae bacterium]